MIDWFNEKISAKLTVPEPQNCLPGRDEPLTLTGVHAVLKTRYLPPFPVNQVSVYLGMGCFWGAERALWSIPGVYSTAVGYGGGTTPNPTYEEVCSGNTGHTELVRVIFDPSTVVLSHVLEVFWQSHDPTQGMRQGNDVGTQYRSFLGLGMELDNSKSALLWEQLTDSKAAYQAALDKNGLGKITTELSDATTFYYAEEYHQQYLQKNPNGYCGLKGTGVSFSEQCAEQ